MAVPQFKSSHSSADLSRKTASQLPTSTEYRAVSCSLHSACWYRLLEWRSPTSPRVAKKLKLQERRAVIPSRRSLAACRPLGFLGRLRAPSRIGGHTRGTYGVGTYPGLHHRDGGP